MELNTVTEEPKEMKWGQISEKHVQLLEKEILANPQYCFGHIKDGKENYQRT